IVAPEPSMKKSSAANRPTPSATPAIEASVRPGLRVRSCHAYLRIRALLPRRAAAIRDASPVAEIDFPVEPIGNDGVVRDDDQGRPQMALCALQESDDRRSARAVQRAR